MYPETQMLAFHAALLDRPSMQKELKDALRISKTVVAFFDDTCDVVLNQVRRERGEGSDRECGCLRRWEEVHVCRMLQCVVEQHGRLCCAEEVCKLCVLRVDEHKGERE